ncbi:MAG: prepilin-type N-terminal cleavage/methylation domain-containing protein [Kyrpidia sp.]|nr:prepilin-type N-terminal cleavage/methylation domain-containing protein [Kyrpidia sp.]
MRKELALQSTHPQEMQKEVKEQAVRRKRQLGFTLIEMLAVVTILAIVSGIGFVMVNSQIERARANTDVANLRTISDAVNRYIMDNGTNNISTNLSGNVQSGANAGNALIGTYLGAAPRDPWNSTNAYSITVTPGTPNKITITSPHTYTSQPNIPGLGGSSATTGLIYNGGTLTLVLNY